MTLIEIKYSSLFLQDLKKLKGTADFKRIHDFCFVEIETYESIMDIPDFKKIKTFQYYFRKRIGNFRIGIKYKDNELVFMRVLNRKEIYRKFP